MSLRVIVLFILIFICSCNQRLIKEEAPNHLDQRELINSAIVFAIDGEFKKSINHYKKALKIKPLPFSNDYHNLLSISNHINDTEMAIVSAIELAKLGMCKEYFRNFEVLQNSSDWYKIEDACNTDKNWINHVLVDSLYELLELDQSVRSYYDEQLSESVNQLKGLERNRIDSLNYLRFQNLINSYGFPSEKIIGIQCSQNNKGIAHKVYDVMLIHFAALNYNPNFDSLMNHIFEEEGITNEEYARYIDQKYQDTIYRMVPVYLIGDIYYVVNHTEKELTQINKRRSQINLLSIENHIKLIHYSLNDPAIPIKYFTALFQFPNGFFNEDQMKKYFTPLEAYINDISIE